ncbi:hypothetical protein [Stagnihabitans tardus]|uniref:DNA cytosine methyltransferase n=1 Tax=Stagnihabitans tardus TaxID=2699202 RepID=A0AAE4YAM8_9RHOB|nr:hypothetical protein [Stagnihabitans tardus]NBZ87926.1 hypothetical protein [Stagnihabitans tardus]
MTPRALIGCETSGQMRRAFAARGWDVWSCDLLPADDGSNRHIRGDVRDLLGEGWDLLAVLHPPCTRLCRAGQRWLYGPGKTRPKALPKGRTWESMVAEFEEACALFSACLHAPIPRRMIENPVMHCHAVEAIQPPKPQVVQPWWFGDPAFKATGLYLAGLPPLVASSPLTPPAHGSEEWRRWSAVHRAAPGPDRWKIRSATFPGLARACADQWGPLVEAATGWTHAAA